MLALDFAAHGLVKVALQAGNFLRQRLQAGKGNGADLAVFQRDGIAVVLLRRDAVQAQDLARHGEAGHLLAAVLEQGLRLEETVAHGIQRGEAIAAAIQAFAAAHAHAIERQAVGDVPLGTGQAAAGHAQLAQVAARAYGLALRDLARDRQRHRIGRRAARRGNIAYCGVAAHKVFQSAQAGGGTNELHAYPRCAAHCAPSE